MDLDQGIFGRFTGAVEIDQDFHISDFHIEGVVAKVTIGSPSGVLDGVLHNAN
jgi:hypothetical protein